MFDTVDDSMLAQLPERSSAAAFALPGTAPGTSSAVAFGSGFGDGVHPVWLGHDDQGRLTEILADFLILPRAA